MSLAGACAASARTDIQDCGGDDPATGDARIAACSAIIDSGHASRDDLAVAYNNRGNIFLGRGELDRAIADYDKAVETDPKYAVAYMNRGNAYSSKGDTARAIADYTKAIELDRDFIEAYVNRGQAYIALKDYDLAIADFDRAARIWNKYAPAWLWRGEAYFLKGEYRRAIEDYDRAVKLKPTWGSALVRACWARALTNVEIDQALDLCSRAIAAKATDRAFNNRGFVYFRLGRFREAIADYDAAVAIKPTAGSLYMRGVCKLRLKDASGNADIEAARGIYPDVADEYARMGAAP